jgi:peptidoglycan/LPS O-acetylase OafA/YrhL
MRARERIDVGPPIAMLGALLLLVSLFLDWYEPGFSAWTVFEVLDLVLAALAVGCLVAAAARLGLELPGSRALWNHLAVFGVLALVLVASQAIDHPPAAVDEDPETGLWLGLGGAGLLALGGLLSVTRISFAVDVEGREPRRPGASPVPDPAARPAPGAPARPVGEPPVRQGGESETTPLDVPPHEREQR